MSSHFFRAYFFIYRHANGTIIIKKTTRFESFHAKKCRIVTFLGIFAAKMSHKRFLSIYDEYADDLLSYGYGLGFAKEDIEDTLQDVILNLYRNDPQLKDVRNVKVYLFTALKNRLMNTTRRQRMDSLDDGT